MKPKAFVYFIMYHILAGANDPPLSVVRKFVHLLEQSALDLQEEQEVTRLREEVVTNIRSNQQMEKDLNLMDIKIGLLVKNRITLQVGSPLYCEPFLMVMYTLVPELILVLVSFFRRMLCTIIRK